MKRRPDADSWMPFTATQTISTVGCEFDWQARAGPFGAITGHDALARGEGTFDILALGVIPLARAKHTDALVRGELMRYLAEIAWAPDAILFNAALRWRVDSPDLISVSAGDHGTASEVILNLDRDGRIAGAYARDRPRSATPPTQPTPWRGRFSEYRMHQDRWIPFSGEVGWEIDGSTQLYWQCRIDDWEVS